MNLVYTNMWKIQPTELIQLQVSKEAGFLQFESAQYETLLK